MGSLLKEGSLGYILLNSQIITEKDIETALEEQKKTGKRFGEILVGLGLVTEEDIDWALSHQLDIPYIRIREDSVDPAAVALVPAHIARKEQLLPLIRTGDELRIAIADPLNKGAIAEVEKLTGCTVSLSMGLQREIREMQDIFYGQDTEKDTLGFVSKYFPASVLEGINEDLTGTKLLDYLLFYLTQKKLSSLSLKPLDKVTVIGRQASASREIGKFPTVHYKGFLASLKKKFGISEGDGRSSQGVLRYSSGETSALLKASVMRAGEWEYVTVKPHVVSPFPGRVAELSASEETKDALTKLCAAPDGLVFFASPEPDERARLIASCARECEKGGRELMMLGRGFGPCGTQAPVIPVDAGSVEMGAWIDLACEHEPSVVAVENIYGSASLTAALGCVLGGRLLLCGLPAPGVGTILRQLCRMKDGFPALTSYLRGAAACRGVRILCPDCKKKAAAPAGGVPSLKDKVPETYYSADGCPRCGNTGYAEKRYLIEAILFNEETINMRNSSAVGLEILRHLSENGFHSIAEQATGLFMAGEITVEDYISATMDNRERIWQE